MFVNVPPINRAPGTSLPSAIEPPSHIAPANGKRENYLNWNTSLATAATLFATTHPDTTVMIYSSWDTFTALLDDPAAHGFPVQDIKKVGASVWYDHLHPTSRVHDLVARDMARFLGAQGAFTAENSG